MFVDGRFVHGRWDSENEESDEEEPYTPPAFMQLLDSIAKSCPVSAVASVLMLQQSLGFALRQPDAPAICAQGQGIWVVTDCSAGTSDTR